MTQRYDLVIAGGGPSGSAAAWQAAQTGARVVVLDKAEFPRAKPCGDGLTARAVSYLQKMGLADEVATMAIALARRVHLVRRAFDIVLAGGVFRTRDAAFYARIADRIGEALPRATIGRLEAPPVLGAAILALDRLPDAAPGAAARLRRSLER